MTKHNNFLFSCMFTWEVTYNCVNFVWFQHALRLIAFRQIHKVLGMDPIPPPKFQRGGRFTRKRRRDNSTGEGNDSEGELDGRHWNFFFFFFFRIVFMFCNGHHNCWFLLCILGCHENMFQVKFLYFPTSLYVPKLSYLIVVKYTTS